MRKGWRKGIDKEVYPDSRIFLVHRDFSSQSYHDLGRSTLDQTIDGEKAVRFSVAAAKAMAAIREA